jgi:hypothetical protein
MAANIDAQASLSAQSIPFSQENGKEGSRV